MSTALDNTFGAAFIGVVVSAILYGITCVQTWFYFSDYEKDGLPMKLLVTAVLLSDTVHQALITHTVYTYLVSNFGNPVELGELVWSLIVEVLFNGFTALMVQSFLAWRIWKLSNGCIWRTGSVMTLVIGEFVCVVIYVSKGINLQTFAELTALKSLSMTVNAVAAAGDVLIAMFLCHLLHGARTGFSRSDSMINRLIVFTINTGLLTSLCAIASLVSIVAAPTTFIYISFYFCLGRLYCNSLLATLNARRALRGEAREDMSLSLQRMPNSPSATAALASGKQIAVNVTVDHERDGSDYQVDYKSSAAEAF
ncbi:hypothetical protein CONPUDRAFT_81986 [Coniophora puteana RWD-64-598 SS2]|uniref:DUF6534 domain-containing protein n=1 Tax=Coniophora puteana (strain RWD-64-598) TaxID=741705 RepID=A0A5M3MTL5_CONPW|nr:uncharacterized protein CONPUDRAFT_81986 [Coniophora puteana RWD-64-598 SS2]EIW82509.1 hypothetical protein CONPUDRAFT_81986 [Coniophora puteana RWD-64-598 SS2]